MKAWLSQSVSRGEVIALALVVQEVGFVLWSGWLVVGSLSAVRATAHELVPASGNAVPPTLDWFLGVGQLKLTFAFAVCAVIPVLAVVTRQRLWVKLAAPVVFGVVAFSVLHSYSTSYTEWISGTRGILAARSANR